MSDLKLTDTGRRSLILVRPVHVTATPDWPTGPLPLRVDTMTASTQTRSTYFSPPCNRILYGTPEHPTRWHLPHDDAAGDDGLLGLELLVPDPSDPAAGLVVAHLTDPGDRQLELLRTAAGRRGATCSLPDLGPLISPFAAEAPDAQTFTIAFRSTTHTLAAPRGIDERLGWTPAQAWLWQLASRSTTADYPPDPDRPDRSLIGTVTLSADWRALVTRDGAAFVALRPDRGPGDPFLGYAHLYTHTTYLDALLLGMIQRTSVKRMITESATAFDTKDAARHLEQLEHRVARFRSIYWLRDASTHGHANSLLNAYHAQHELPDRFEAVLNEIADLSRIVQARDSQLIGAALGVLTIVGLPLGVALETLQALGTNSPRHLAIALTVALAVTGGLLATRPGRVLIRQIRQLR